MAGGPDLHLSAVDGRFDGVVAMAVPVGALGLGGILWRVAASKAGDPAQERAARAPLAGLLFFVGTLFPALGFLNVYPFRYSYVADHFQYLASLGLIVPAAAGLSVLTARIPAAAKSAAWVLGATQLALCAVLTWRQCGMYRDAETLYRTTLACNPDCWLAHNNLGLLWSEKPGRLNDAIFRYQEALRLDPNNAPGWHNLGACLYESGDLSAAVAAFREDLRLSPNDVAAREALSAVLQEEKRHQTGE
jgi:tetratricopeptide (TPR) repeat protein